MLASVTSTRPSAIRAYASVWYGSGRAGRVPGSCTGIFWSAAWAGLPAGGGRMGTGPGLCTAGCFSAVSKSNAEVRSPHIRRRHAVMLGSSIPVHFSRKRLTEVWSNSSEQT